MKRKRPEPLRSLEALGEVRLGERRGESRAAVQAVAPVGLNRPAPAALLEAAAARAGTVTAPRGAHEDSAALFAQAVADVVRAPVAATDARPPRSRRSRAGFTRSAERILPPAAPEHVHEAPARRRGDPAAAGEDRAIEGSAVGIDQRWLRRLRRGEVPVEGRLDLHGATRHDAKARVERFVVASRQRGLRCVLIVHGRGLHSPEGLPVLKEELRAWLLQGTLGACTMAFCSARGRDGGLGATYVLLRRA